MNASPPDDQDDGAAHRQQVEVGRVDRFHLLVQAGKSTDFGLPKGEKDRYQRDGHDQEHLHEITGQGRQTLRPPVPPA